MRTIVQTVVLAVLTLVRGFSRTRYLDSEVEVAGTDGSSDVSTTERMTIHCPSKKRKIVVTWHE